MAHIHCSVCPSPAQYSHVGRVALGTKTDPLLEEVGKKKIQEVFFYLSAVHKGVDLSSLRCSIFLLCFSSLPCAN